MADYWKRKEQDLPPQVAEWLEDNPDCRVLIPTPMPTKHVIVFPDDMAATAFKIKFREMFK